METSDLIKILRIPQPTVINRNVPKRQFYEHLSSSKGQGLIQTDVDTVYWLSSVRPNNSGFTVTNDGETSFEEIEVFYVRVRNSDREEAIFRQINSAIPYPLIIFFDLDNRITVGVAEYSYGKAHGMSIERVVISSILSNHFMDSMLVPTKEPGTTLFEYYKGIQNRVLSVTLQADFNKSPMDIDIKGYSEILRLQSEVETLQTEVIKENQLNLRVELQLQLAEKKKLLNQLLSN